MFVCQMTLELEAKQIEQKLGSDTSMCIFPDCTLTTFSSVLLIYVSDSEIKDCCGYFILYATYFKISYNLVQ